MAQNAARSGSAKPNRDCIHVTMSKEPPRTTTKFLFIPTGSLPTKPRSRAADTSAAASTPSVCSNGSADRASSSAGSS